LQASSKSAHNKAVMDKTDSAASFELVVFESGVCDTQESNVSPVSDVQVFIAQLNTDVHC